MENEIKPMTKKELIRRIEEYKPKYIYQRYNGEIRQFEVIDNNYLVDTKTGMSFDFRSHLMLGKVSEDLIDLIQCGDYVNGKQVSNVDKIDNINFIEWTDGDMYKTEIENDKFIETIVTKEMMESISYKVTKM